MQKPFERIVAEHGSTVLRVCRAVVGSADADDAWSETFIAALRAYPELPGDADVAAWLVTIAHRKAIDLIRARNRRALPVADPPDPPVRADPPDGPDVWDWVRTLPDRQRTCLAYHYLAGLPYRRIAEITGGTEAAARRAAADGLKTLRAAHAAPATTGATS